MNQFDRVQQPPTSSPLDVVKAFIACMKTKELESMRKLTHANATSCLIREYEPRFQTLSESMDVLGKAGQHFDGAIWDEVEHRDGDYATVWAKFSIKRDGEVSTCIAFQGEWC